MHHISMNTNFRNESLLENFVLVVISCYYMKAKSELPQYFERPAPLCLGILKWQAPHDPRPKFYDKKASYPST